MSEPELDPEAPTPKPVVILAAIFVGAVLTTILFFVVFTIGMLTGPAWAALSSQYGRVGASSVVALVVSCPLGLWAMWQITAARLRRG